MRTKLLLIKLSFCVTVALLLSGCSSSQQLPSELPSDIIEPQQVSIGAIKGKSLEDYMFGFSFGGVADYSIPLEKMALQACEDLEIPPILIDTPENWIQSEQDIALDNLVSLGAKSIFMMPSEATAGNTKISELSQKGLEIVCVGGAPDLPSESVLTLETDNYQCAYDATLKVIEHLEYEGNIIGISGAQTDTNSKKRLQGIADACARYEGIVLLELVDGISTTQSGLEIVGEVLERQGENVDGIVAMDYYAAQAMAHYLLYETKYQEIVCIGIDSDPLVLEAIAQGKMMGSMSQNPWAQGYIAVYTLKMLEDGWIYKQNQPHLIDTGTLLISADNTSDFEQQMIDQAYDMVKTWGDRFHPPQNSYQVEE